MIATLAAADDSLRLLAQSQARRRMVCVAEVPERVLSLADELPSACRLTEALPWQDVETILVDEPGGKTSWIGRSPAITMHSWQRAISISCGMTSSSVQRLPPNLAAVPCGFSTVLKRPGALSCHGKR